MKKKTIIWLAVSVGVILIALACVRLFFSVGVSRFYGGYLVLGVIIGLLAWKAFSRTDKDEVADLRKTIRNLDRELAEKTTGRINVVGLNPILHVATMNVDTSFVRPYVREEGNMTFNGALKADMQIEYGIKMEEVRYRYDAESNNLTLANFHPGIISYSKKQLKWEFARTFKSRSLLGHDLPPFSDTEADKFTQRMCEQLRNELESEIDKRQVTEFEWLKPLVTEQVVDVLKLMVGKENINITIAEGNGDESFLEFKELKQLQS